MTMSMITIIVKSFLFLFLLLCSCLPNSNGLDYYLLAVQWPPSVCSQPRTSCFTPIPSDFKIHGLWPSLYSGATIPPTGPSYTAAALRRILAPGLVRDLEPVWPQLLNRGQNLPNYDFWAYEWNKHGCVSQLPVSRYFEDAKNLFHKLDVKNKLQAGGIIAGNSYTGTRIQRAAGGSSAGLNPRITCWREQTGRYALLEIRYCADLNREPMPCRRVSWASCGGSGNNNVFVYA